jgi:hypothetical protein
MTTPLLKEVQIMLGKWFTGGAAALVVSALTVAAVSGMTGESGSTDDQVVAAADQPSEDPAPEAALSEEEGPEEGEDVALQADEGASAEDPAGALKVATAIAGEFEVSPDEVMAFHDEGIGFGALFKLYNIARARGMSVQELLATLEKEDGEYAFGFGNLKKSLTDEELATLEEGPKNLGELVSAASKKSEETTEITSDEQTLAPAASGNESGGPPAHARAKGHGKKK